MEAEGELKERTEVMKFICPLCENTFLLIYEGDRSDLKGRFIACPKCDPVGVAKESDLKR